MPSFRLLVWYAASDEDSPQEHVAVPFDAAKVAVGAFMRDMESLEGRGVRKLTIEVTP